MGLPSAQPEHNGSLVPPQGYTSMPKQQQFARSAAEAPAARAASAELQRQHTPLQGAVGAAMPQLRAGKRKHGCRSCCWCAAGCEQCRADYGRGLAVSTTPASISGLCVVTRCSLPFMCAHAAKYCSSRAG